jgi:hypothetical protein
MALVLKDRVKETSTTAGTGTLTLAGAVSGFQSFAAVGNGNTTYYAIADSVTGDWEVGIGTYTSSGTTLSRTTVLSSSNGGSLVNFSANSKDVFVTYPSEKSVYEDAAGVVVQQSFGAITATSAALTTGTITTAPVSNTDIVNKQYADAIASGIHFHEAVNLATTAALPANTYNNGASGVGATLTGNANGALSVDSTLTTASERILVKNEAAGANNGVYTVTQVGSAGTPYILTRATDFDSVGTGVNEIDEGDFFLVTSGTANVNTAWVQQTPPPITIGTTAIVFQQFSAPITYTAGTGLNESPTYTFNIATTGVTATTYGSASQVPVFAVNAQGQLTSVTNTAIAINGSAVSGNISGSAGSVANALTLGTYLTGTSYNGSSAVTAAVDATSVNTVSKVVARDSSGNFAAGTITAALSGNASTATAATNISGGAANQIPYQTGAATTSFVVAPTTAGTYLNWNGSAFAYSALSLPNLLTINNGGAGGASGSTFNGSSALTISYNTVGAPSTGGTGATGTWGISISGNAATATALQTARTIGGVSFNGTANIDLPGVNTAGNQNTSGNAATATTATNQSGGTVSATAITLTTANGYINANRTSSGSGEIGYTWSSAGVVTWYNYLNTSATTLTWYSSASGAVMTLTAGGALNTVGAITQNGSQVLTAGNYNSYAPSLTGASASGTWNINVTGNAATATSATSATTAGSITSQANSATITASSSNTANQIVLRDASGNFSAGTITATLSGNASTASTASNANTVGGFTPSQSAGVANRVVVANASGYIDNTYFYTSSGGAERNTSGMGYFAGFNTGDYYIRSYTAGAVASLLSGQTMNINGSSTSCSGNAATATTATNQSGGSVNATTIYGSSYVNTAGPYYRNVAGAGYLNGQYGSVESTTTSGAIYSIGGSYVPGSTNLGNMYGVGYTYSTVAAGSTGAPASLWGFYVASGGTSRVFLDSDNGRGYFASNLYVNGGTQVVYNSGTWGINVTGSSGSCTGNAATATTATTATTANALATGNNYQVNSLGVGTAASGTAGEIRATNAVTAYYSDDRLKTKLGNIEGALAKVKTLSGFYYEANETAQALGYKPKREVGVSAQSVQAVLPEVVVPAPIDEQYLTVHYDKLVPLLIEAIKELEAKVAALEAKG